MLLLASRGSGISLPQGRTLRHKGASGLLYSVHHQHYDVGPLSLSRAIQGFQEGACTSQNPIHRVIDRKEWFLWVFEVARHHRLCRGFGHLPPRALPTS